eukprot:PhF_6_TR30109/c0_g1_i1/m.43949
MDDLVKVLQFTTSRPIDRHSLEYYDVTSRDFFPLSSFERLPIATTIRLGSYAGGGGGVSQGNNNYNNNNANNANNSSGGGGGIASKAIATGGMILHSISKLAHVGGGHNNTNNNNSNNSGGGSSSNGSSSNTIGPILIRPKVNNAPDSLGGGHSSIVFKVAPPVDLPSDAKKVQQSQQLQIHTVITTCAEMAHTAVSETSRRGHSQDQMWESYIDYLVQTLQLYIGNANVVTVCILALWNVTSHVVAQRYACRTPCVHLVCATLVRHFHHPSIVSGSMGVLRNLALYNANCEALFSWGGLHLMISALRQYTGTHRGVVLRSLAALAPATAMRSSYRLVVMQSTLSETMATVFERYPGVDCVVFRWVRLITSLVECPNCDSHKPAGHNNACDQCEGLAKTLALQFVANHVVDHLLEALRKFRSYSGIVLHACIALHAMCNMPPPGAPAAPPFSQTIPPEILPLLEVHSDNPQVVCRVLRLLARIAQHSSATRSMLLTPSLKCIERSLVVMSKSLGDENVQAQGLFLLETFLFANEDGFGVRLLRAGAPFILTSVMRSFPSSDKLCLGCVRSLHFIATHVKSTEFKCLLQQCGAAQCLGELEMRLPKRSEGAKACRDVLKLLA